MCVRNGLTCTNRVTHHEACTFTATGPYTNQMSVSSYNGAQSFMCYQGTFII